MIDFDVNYFWNRMKDKTGLGDELMKICEAVGLNQDGVKGKSIGTKVFVSSKEGLNTISIKYKSGVSSINSTYEQVLRSMGLYANYLADNHGMSEIYVSQGARTPEEQADFVYKDAEKYPNISDTNAMYKGTIGIKTRKAIAENQSVEEVKKMIVEYVKAKPDGFRHVSSSSNTIDIAAGATRQTRSFSFCASFAHFQKHDKFISSTNSIPLGKDGETDAFHTVFK